MGVSEINALYSKQKDDYLYEICNGYIKLSIVFHPMAIFWEIWKINFSQAY